MPHLTDIFADCKYLYLDKLFEPAENQLAMRVLEATDGGSVPTAILDAEPLEPVKAILAQAKSIEHCIGCRIFDITWHSYVGYSVLNESFALPEPKTSIGIGRLFVEYQSSTYLEYLNRASWACAEHPGPYRHWAALCLNHIVDVASVDEPKITVSVAQTNQICPSGNFSVPAKRG
ncbi:hypothetical protein [Achromobacter sp. Root83]|uniref:hypothetical protein n=1 Tax=Achromobacter sp. Root83 TaxID=1736602 RepID=UPI0012E34612|nr:hypothetical protein [Achromobacter sp. Root83]